MTVDPSSAMSIDPTKTQRMVVACSDATKRYVVLGAILASNLAFIDGTVVTVGLNNIRLALGASLAQARCVFPAR
jgi:hypothetical protein